MISLIDVISNEKPDGVFIGGDILPHGGDHATFIEDHLLAPIRRLRENGISSRIFLIPGNDDPGMSMDIMNRPTDPSRVECISERTVEFSDLFVTGYPYVPPTPFRLKDWERYDVSRYTDPGCIPPEEGIFTIEVDRRSILYKTISADLSLMSETSPPDRTIYLFHSPPHNTNLDRADIDNVLIDGVSPDVHVGSIAIRKFIECHQPLLTLHGHIHESRTLTGEWRDQIGRTRLFSAANDGNGLALVRFDTDDLDSATIEIIDG